MGNQGDLLINDGQIKRTTETGRLFLPSITEPDGKNPMHYCNNLWQSWTSRPRLPGAIFGRSSQFRSNFSPPLTMKWTDARADTVEATAFHLHRDEDDMEIRACPFIRQAKDVLHVSIGLLVGHEERVVRFLRLIVEWYWRLKYFLPVVILLLALLGSCDLVVQLLIVTPTAFVLILVLVFILHVYMSIIQQSTVKIILHP